MRQIFVFSAFDMKNFIIPGPK